MRALVLPSLTKYLIPLVLLGMGCSTALRAQDLQFEPFTTADGLPTEYDYNSMVQDRQGYLWVASVNGLTRYDGYQFQTYRHDPLDSTSISDNTINALYEDQDGMLWVGTVGGGLNRYDAATHTLTRFRHDPEDPTSLSSDDVLAFYEDRQGERWIGTFDKGINKAMASFNRFRNYAEDEIRANNGVLELYEDDEGLLWIGTYTGQLFRFDPATEALERISNSEPAPDGLWGSGITAVLKDRDGMLWVGQNRGVYRIDPVKKTHTAFHPDPADPNSLSSDAILFVEEDEQGSVWIGTVGGGLDRYDPRTGRFTHFRHDPADENSLSGNMPATLYQDRQGVRWVGDFGGGVNRFDEETETFTTYLIGGNVEHIYEDRAGRFWVATGTDGLYLLDRATGQTVQHYTTDEGLPNNAVSGIVEDSPGLLWLTTASGLARFNPATENFTIYNEDDGLDNYTTMRNLALLSQDGTLFIGGLKGLTGIRPEAFTPNPIPPTSVITSLRVFNEDVSLMGRQEAPITLAHDENELTVEYVGLHFANPSRNQYTYRLEGYDTDWRQAGTVRTATYTNLSPGTYTFRVKASNSDGVWNVEEATLRVTIRPPWWQTWWAYALYGLLFLAGVFAVDRVQRRRLIAKERQRAEVEHERLRAEAALRELEQAREIEQAYHQLEEAHDHLKATQAQLIQSEKMASLGALTAGIAHEIKNPLNFITNFAEVNEELAQELRDALAHGQDPGAIIDDLEQNARVITQHGHRADGIVRSMMQHASGGAGQRAPTDVNALVEEYTGLAYHGKRAQIPDFNAEIRQDLDDAVGTVEMVPQEIGRVLLNLLSNAFDAVHEKADAETGGRRDAETGYAPTVTVSTRRNGDTVEIRVEDNGGGIPADVQEKIFEPFFTTKPTGSGTGLGLSLSYDIVTQGHGGTLTVESEEGKEAMFVVTLPG